MERVKKLQIAADLGFVLVSVFWGFSTVISKLAMFDIPPFTLQAFRFTVAALLLAACFPRLFQRITKRDCLLAILGAVLMLAAYTLNLFSLHHTTVANTAFFASLPVVMIPAIKAVITRKLPPLPVYIAVAFCIVGLYFMTGFSGKAFNLGDFLAIACSFFYALYVLYVEKYAAQVDGMVFSTVQLLAMGCYATILSIIFEDATVAMFVDNWVAVLALTVLGTAVVTPIQIYALRYTTATRAGVIMLLEPVASAILAFIIFVELLTMSGYLGCGFILLGLLLAEWKHI